MSTKSVSVCYKHGEEYIYVGKPQDMLVSNKCSAVFVGQDIFK
jgi:hypothetical protein